MSTPIYKISDRAPEFPCWLWSLLENEWQQREHLIGDVDTLYDFTHWCHSETRPTVTPDAGSKLDALTEEIHRAGVYDAQPTPSAPDVQRVAEGITRVAEDYLEDSLGVGYLVNADGQKAIASILTRFAAELTAQKDAEIARLNKACDAFSNAEILSGDWKARAEKAEAELAEAQKQAKLAWDRHAEKDRAYGEALRERDQLSAEVDRLTTISGQYSGSIADLRAEVQAKQHAIDAATTQIAQLSAEVERLTKARNLDAEAMNLYAEQVSDLRAELAASEARHADAQTAIRNGLEREDALKAQLAAAQEDTERLDVLQEKWVVWPGKPSNSLREEADRLRAIGITRPKEGE